MVAAWHKRCQPSDGRAVAPLRMRWYDGGNRMNDADEIRRWRREAESYLETAASLFRKRRYPQMMQQCYIALQSALEAAFLAKHGARAPASVSLVFVAEGLDRNWSPAERELLVELTECARAMGNGMIEAAALRCTKEGCLHKLTLTASLVAELG